MRDKFTLWRRQKKVLHTSGATSAVCILTLNCTISTRDPYSMRAKRRDANARSYGKQERRADPEVWRFIVLVRGMVHFLVMGSDWRQDGAGQAMFVGRLEAVAEFVRPRSEDATRGVFRRRARTSQEERALHPRIHT